MDHAVNSRDDDTPPATPIALKAHVDASEARIIAAIDRVLTELAPMRLAIKALEMRIHSHEADTIDRLQSIERRVSDLEGRLGQ